MYFDVDIILVKNEITKLIYKTKIATEKKKITKNQLEALETLKNSLIVINTLREMIEQYEKGISTIRKQYTSLTITNTKLKKENKLLKENIEFLKPKEDD